MKITFQEAKRSTEVHAIHCPSCGERVRSVVLLPGCNITGLSVRCKRCGKMKSVEAHDDVIRAPSHPTLSGALPHGEPK